jgi:hypothetical protein
VQIPDAFFEWMVLWERGLGDGCAAPRAAFLIDVLVGGQVCSSCESECASARGRERNNGRSSLLRMSYPTITHSQVESKSLVKKAR